MNARILRIQCLMAGLLLAAGAVLASPAVLVRQVRASHGPARIDPALQDVGGLLQQNVPFSVFTLMHQGSYTPPGRAVLTLAAGYQVLCRGDAGNMRIEISRQGESLLNTTVSVAPGQPLVLGGFSAPDGGRILFIFTRAGSR